MCIFIENINNSGNLSIGNNLNHPKLTKSKLVVIDLAAEEEFSRISNAIVDDDGNIRIKNETKE
jgi:hypothetical protein